MIVCSADLRLLRERQKQIEEMGCYVVGKPFDLDTLLSTVRGALAGSRQPGNQDCKTSPSRAPATSLRGRDRAAWVFGAFTRPAWVIVSATSLCRWSEKLKQFRGIGTVLKGGQEIARVQYSLMKSADPFSALSRTQGFARPLRGHVDVGIPYVLRLSDGREVDFFARYTHGIDYPHATYSVTVSGDPEA